MTTLHQEYRRLRKLGERARWAFASAKTLVAWQALGGETVTQGYDDDEPGTVRLKLVCDDHPYDDSYIDTWDDVAPERRERIRQDLWNKIEQDGVWGVVGEFWDGNEWQHADSCWGFVGNDWKDSGYDTDIMAATIDAYNEHLASMARALEATRPDMYSRAKPH